MNQIIIYSGKILDNTSLIADLNMKASHFIVLLIKKSQNNFNNNLNSESLINSGNPTLDKFIKLYLKNAEGYDGVTDFTNANQKLDPFFIRDIKPLIMQHQ